MHHGILIKVCGNSLKSAEEYADGIMQKTICCPQCNCSVRNVNWDYFTFVGEVNKKYIKDNREDWVEKGITSPEQLPELYMKHLDEEEKYYIEKVKEAHGKLIDEDGNIDVVLSGSRLTYYIEKLEAVRAIKEYGEADDHLYTLHCTDNHFCDLSDDIAGTNIYWLWYDRHY